MNIVLTGPMGSGKTAVGMLAAEKLGMKFIDTDRIIEETSGSSINRIFMNEGEEHFREMERKIIKEVSKDAGAVIATGGGAVLSPENMKALRMNGIIVNLQAPAKVLSGRLKNSHNRPLLGAGSLEDYLKMRARYYSNCDFKIDTGSMSVDDATEQVCGIARNRFARICGCISGKNAADDILWAAENGVTMLELRLDLIPNPDIQKLVRVCPVPVIATDRKNKEHLKDAIRAGCDFADIEADSPEKDEIIAMARKEGCRVIASYHNFDRMPISFPEKGDADFLKIAVKVNSDDDVKKLITLLGNREDMIVVGMGPHGTPLRVFAPMLGSFLTYCSIGEKTADGQPDLQSLISLYREMGLR